MATDSFLLELSNAVPEAAIGHKGLMERTDIVHNENDARKILEDFDPSSAKSKDFSDLSFLMSNEHQARSGDRFCRMYGFPKIFLSDAAINKTSSQDKSIIASNTKKALEISFEEISKDNKLSIVETVFWQEDIFNYLRLLSLYDSKESLEKTLSKAETIFPEDQFFNSELQKISSIKSPVEAQLVHLVRHKLKEDYLPHYSYSDSNKFPVFEPRGRERIFRYKDLTMTITTRSYTNETSADGKGYRIMEGVPFLKVDFLPKDNTIFSKSNGRMAEDILTGIIGMREFLLFVQTHPELGLTEATIIRGETSYRMALASERVGFHIFDYERLTREAVLASPGGGEDGRRSIYDNTEVHVITTIREVRAALDSLEGDGYIDMLKKRVGYVDSEWD